MTVLVWDTSPLMHAALAERLDVLADYARGTPGREWRNVVTGPVVKELARNRIEPDLSWLEIVQLDELDELTALVRWAQLLGVNTKTGLNLGETSVCAWAEIHGATAIIDDADARKVAKTSGILVHGSLWVIATAVRDSGRGETTADNFVRSLIDSGMRYPKMPDGFCAWARQNTLL
ncbi:hypothetical protein L6E12_16250 [Actinokineospora sp. PR83]|uniref:hypothetical protein n=1 Tax=Actinokineospora sp. PR83 TaxID=2884908 RepID=UPI001F19C9A3|nr:hypothetical protein [Actinokineospora sp. PR83]MCG8917339.1 hypothetical protein [Actinokineospora sp. PR83]